MEQAYKKRTGKITRFWFIETNPKKPINLIYTATQHDGKTAVFKTQYKTYNSKTAALNDAKRLIKEKLERGYQLEHLQSASEKPQKAIKQDVNLSKKKLDWLRSIYRSEISVRELRRELKPITDPMLLHYVAWISAETLTGHDVGFEWPKSVLIHPYCDAGTALMIYWLGNPEYAYSVEPNDWQRPNQRDLKKIENAFLNDAFRSKQIAFDPSPFLPPAKSRNVIRKMPYGMTIPTNGKTFKPLRIENREGHYFF